MKKFILLFSVLFSGITFAAQPLSGTFKNGSDSLVFNGEQVIFSVSGFGGLSTTQVGVGTYEKTGNFLMIHTSEYPDGNLPVPETYFYVPGTPTCVS